MESSYPPQKSRMALVTYLTECRESGIMGFLTLVHKNPYGFYSLNPTTIL